MKKAKMKGTHLSWIVVSDFAKAKKFFTETLGLKAMNVADEFGWMELQGPEGALIGVSTHNQYSAIKPGQHAVITLSVDNIELATKELSEKGVKIIGDVCEVPGHVKLQLFADPDGNLFQLVQDLS